MERSLPSENGIQAILFDLDGTLRHSRPSANHTIIDFAVQLGIPDGIDKRLHTLRWIHYYWAQSPELIEDKNKFGELNEQSWTHFIFRTLVSFECTLEEAVDLAPVLYRRMIDDYEAEDWVPEDVPETLQHLTNAGYPLGVVSNRMNAFDDLLADLGLCEYFDFTLAAGDVNAWKPDPAIFNQAVEWLGVLPEQILYLGDNFYADVVGARRAGLKPVLIDPEGIFPDADCTIVNQVNELIPLLND